MVFNRSDVPGCDECAAFDENPEEFAERELCPVCLWDAEVDNPVLFYLLRFLCLQDAGCPVGRHELTDPEWRLLGILKGEREKLMWEKSKNKDS